MPGIEIATLAWVAEGLRGLANTVLGDRLKRRPAVEIAWKRTLAVYECLGLVEDETERFVTILGVFAHADDETARKKYGQALQPVDPRGMPPVQILHGSIRRLVLTLRRLSDTLEDIDPQLSIHAPELAVSFHRVVQLRGTAVNHVTYAAEQAVPGMEFSSKEELTRIHGEALVALGEIQLLTDELRNFMAQEFSYKEGF